MKSLRTSLVQTSLFWHQPETNRQSLQQKLLPLRNQTDVVILPEMFTSGFTTCPEDLANGSHTIDWLSRQARVLNAAIVGSVATAVDTGAAGKVRYVNRLWFVPPQGEFFYYDKVHLFRMGNEHRRYQTGQQRTVVEFRGWRLLLIICYDLRFPVFCRNRQDYDAIICVANWPASRALHWRTLLQARAIENQSYVLGVNRVGIDGQNISYIGDSLAVAPRGELLIDQPGEWVRTVELNGEDLCDYRQQFPAWQDADAFDLHLQPRS
ncbi:MAG: omega-amidase [Cellvibrionaceae bacterium]|jgi:omega-amidase